MYQTTARKLLDTAAFLKANPDAGIKTGLWNKPAWDKDDFDRWFMRCLHAKINRNDTRAMWRKAQDEYQHDLRLDAHIVNEYHGKRIRRTGTGNLRTAEMRQRYPEVNNQRFED